MPDLQSVRHRRAGEKATRDDIHHIIGDIDDLAVAEIVKLEPTVADLEEAAIWASGDGDVLAKDGRTLSATAAQILDIVQAEAEERLPPEE